VRTVPLEHLVKFVSGGTPSRSNSSYFQGEIPWITGADIDASGAPRARFLITEDAVRSSATSLVASGTILLVTRTSVGKVGVANKPLCFSQDITGLALRSNQVDHRYLVRYLRAQGEGLARRARGATIQGITREVVASLQVPLPPLDQQRRIAAILDQADALRTKRRPSVQWLESLKRSLYWDMFERQPATGEWRQIGVFADVQSGSTPSRKVAGNFGGAIPWVKTGEVDGLVLATAEYVTEQGLRGAHLRLFPRDSVIVAMYGQGATRGRSAILGIEATTNQACAVIVANDRFDPLFLQTQLALDYGRLRGVAEGGNQPNLSVGRVKKFEVRLPPIERQRAFASRCAAVDAQRATAERSLQTLDELFVSLQARAFSGQL
jgi:type I restriction enzyme S subunit